MHSSQAPNLKVIFKVNYKIISNNGYEHANIHNNKIKIRWVQRWKGD